MRDTAGRRRRRTLGRALGRTPVGGVAHAPRQLGRALAFAATTAWGIYHPRASIASSPEQTPAERGLGFETWTWTTRRDRLTVEGWFVEGDGPAAVLVQHGVGRSRSETLDHVVALHRAGYHVLTTDLRNHGSSGRCRSIVRLADRYTSDLVDALEELSHDARVRGPLGCLSMSFSTWPAISAGADPTASGLGLRAIVCDSGPVVDIGGAIRRLTRALVRRDPRFTDDWARDLAVRLTPVIAARMLAVRHWPRTGCRVPVLLIAGGRDRLLPGSDVLAMEDHLDTCRGVLFPRAGHLRALLTDPGRYEAEVAGFLDHHLRPGSSSAVAGRGPGGGHGALRAGSAATASPRAVGAGETS